MSIIATSSGGSDFQLSPAGNHLARCYRIVDMGSTINPVYNTESRKILISWELHGEDNEGNPMVTADGKPLIASSSFTLSLSEKATLRKILESWRNKPFDLKELNGFDITALLDKWCMVNIVHEPSKTGKVYANVKAVSPVPQAIKKNGLPEGINDIFSLSLEPEDFDRTKFDKLSDALKKKIMETGEYKRLNVTDSINPAATKGLTDIDEDIPF
jgi:hypothetical protein